MRARGSIQRRRALARMKGLDQQQTYMLFFPGGGCSSSLPSNAGGASVWEVRSATQPQGRRQLPGLLVPGWGMIVIHIA